MILFSDEVFTQIRYTPSSGIWWSRAVLYKVIMTLASSWDHDDIQFYPPILASGGQEQYYTMWA